MNRYFSALIGILAGTMLCASAQQSPIITKASMPTAGFFPRYSIGDSLTSIDVTQTGTNQLWDFTNINPIAQQTDTFVSPNSISFGFKLQFSSATVAQPATQDSVNLGVITLTNSYTFFKTTTKAFINQGFGALTTSFPLPLALVNNPADTVYSFPLTYGSQDSCYSYAVLNIPSLFSIERTQTRKYTADGWGTLKTNYGTFPAVRVRTELDGSDSISLNGFGFNIPRTGSREYHWLTPTEQGSMVQINTNSFGGTETISQVQYRDSLRNGVITIRNDKSVPQMRFDVYPNPAAEQIRVAMQQSLGADAIIRFYDITGRELFRQPFDGTSMIDISAFAAGNYTVRIESAKGVFTGKMAIQR